MPLMMQQGQPLQITLTGWCRQSELRDNSVRGQEKFSQAARKYNKPYFPAAPSCQIPSCRRFFAANSASVYDTCVQQLLVPLNFFHSIGLRSLCIPALVNFPCIGIDHFHQRSRHFMQFAYSPFPCHAFPAYRSSVSPSSPKGTGMIRHLIPQLRSSDRRHSASARVRLVMDCRIDRRAPLCGEATPPPLPSPDFWTDGISPSKKIN